jgi:hypothetical protein
VQTHRKTVSIKSSPLFFFAYFTSTKIPNKSARIYKFTVKNVLKFKTSCSKIVLACHFVQSVFRLCFQVPD